MRLVAGSGVVNSSAPCAVCIDHLCDSFETLLRGAGTSPPQGAPAGNMFADQFAQQQAIAGRRTAVLVAS
eukprot:5383970-Amphidinium_carterae.1